VIDQCVDTLLDGGDMGGLQPEPVDKSRARSRSAKRPQVVQAFKAFTAFIPEGSAGAARNRARTPGRFPAVPASFCTHAGQWYGRGRQKPRRSRAGSAG